MKHSKYNEIKTLVKNNINVLLEGDRGSGKTTIIKQLAEDLELPFYSLGMTKQTTMNIMLGFKSINGNYIPSLLREAVENGGIMLLDEIDGSDPNTLLCLNSLENGYLACPDKVVEVHEDFRLVATSNPAGEHSVYTGRSTLDAATLDRFDVIQIPRDPNLEKHLTSKAIVNKVEVIRRILIDQGVTKTVSMRDAIRFHKRAKLGIADNYHEVLLGEQNTDLFQVYLDEISKQIPRSVANAKTFAELYEIIQEGE